MGYDKIRILLMCHSFVVLLQDCYERKANVKHRLLPINQPKPVTMVVGMTNDKTAVEVVFYFRLSFLSFRANLMECCNEFLLFQS